MYQYYIVEIQQLSNGEYAHFVHFAWDEDADRARLKAEAKYHEILSYAAVSETKKHSAVILSDESFPILNQCYKHNLPEPEPEPVEEPEEEQEEEPEEPEEPAEENGGGGE